MGLQSDYTNDRGTYAFIRKVMALPFLPADEIPEMYAHLEEIPESRKLQDFMQYVGRTWITSRTWPPSSWSVFMKSIRMNYDIEGWHLGLNRRAAGKLQLPLYLLISLLHREARLTSLQIRLVSEKKLCAFSGRSSGTSRRRSSLYGMRLALETAVQESS